MSEEIEDIDSTTDGVQDKDEKDTQDEIRDDESQDDYIARLKSQNQQLYARLKKSKSEPEKKSEVKETKTTEDFTVNTLLDLQAQGFSPAEIKAIVDESKDLGISVSKVVSNEKFMKGFKSHFDEIKKKDDFNKATPSSTGGSTLAEIGKKPVKDMTADEKQGAFEKLTNKFRK